MSKSSIVRTGDVEYNGAGVTIANLGSLTNAASAVPGAFYTVPFDCYIAEVVLNITTQFTHADAALNIGTIGDIDAIVDAYDLTNVATGVQVWAADGSFVSAAIRKLSRGDVINANLEASDTTGKIGVSLVLVPRQD